MTHQLQVADLIFNVIPDRVPLLIVKEIGRGLGLEPTERELEKLGYNIECRIPVWVFRII